MSQPSRAPAGEELNGAGRGWGPRPGEEAGVPGLASAPLRLARDFDGAPAGEEDNGAGRGWGPRPGEEAGVGAPAGEEDTGQAAVEVALALPIVAVLLLAVVQLALVVRDQVMVVHAAREAARAGAVDRSEGAPGRAAAAGAPLAPDRLEVATVRRPDAVEVTVRYRSPTGVPVVGALLPDVALRARASMRPETEP